MQYLNKSTLTDAGEKHFANSISKYALIFEQRKIFKQAYALLVHFFYSAVSLDLRYFCMAYVCEILDFPKRTLFQSILSLIYLLQFQVIL